ncbi:hypothetical protein AGABI2DRAFT_195533 [Agaricus bisporus var. bisporus H97]|uniref:hypothetical protein n=1 Tax=Agaricus bisporus var. bisporus (strain H97 / ATCC MYA-4626 / FGSC 10389) TaxID=936046 RepID=UPI00029F65F0|nr:hypothetical protein AGABI2DRAFT_195533 [Agaricus bisporus var. bisporus H97]EKV42710.1 hypothetical protein AGABI2DRAFT_195533 [Agaricus bisporus var. bisporus H97]
MKSWIKLIFSALPWGLWTHEPQTFESWKGVLETYRNTYNDKASVLAPRDCSPQIAAINFARREAHGHSNRAFDMDIGTLTCVAAPETPLEDYVRPPIRQDVREGQTGIQMRLDVTVIDVTTCESMPNVMVEVWSSNAVGSYGSSFLRGAFTSARDGVAQFQTVFPGYTSTGANHVNLMVHASDSMSGSTVSHVGQVFFTDRWTDVVSMTSPYNRNNNTRVCNSQDPNYAAATTGGYNAHVDIQSIHDDWPEGVVGYITIGVNPENRNIPH